MRILAVNWLDLRNPQAGGAEVHFFEVFRRLVERGHEVTMIASGWRECAPMEMVQGIAVRRYGGRYTFALHGRGAVRRALAAERYDVVVEDINKLPLFLPSVTHLPFFVIVPHLFGTTAFLEASWPVASIVWLAELPIPIMYRRASFQAISESTRDDLVARGVAKQAIRVVYPGVDTSVYTPDPTARAATPTFLYVGRLKRYKGIDVAIRAIAEARRHDDRLRLEIVGSGDDLHRLQRLANRLGVADAVEFLGFVTEEVKIERLRWAWAVVFASPKEGWGISNVEAAACGTASVASDSPGLRESVLDGQTGMLVPHGDVEALAAALLRLGRDPDLVATYGSAARQFAERLSWDETVAQTETHLVETVERFSDSAKE